MKLKQFIHFKAVVSGLMIALGASLCFCIFNNLVAVKDGFLKFLSYLSPVTGGIMVAYLLRPIARFMEEKMLRRIKSQKARVHISGLTCIVLFLVLLVFLVSIVFPQVKTSVFSFAENFDSYYASARTFIADFASRISFLNIDVNELLGSSDDFFGSISTWLSNNITSFIGFFYQFSSFLLNFVIIVAMACYALLDRKNIKRGMIRLEKVLIGPVRAQRVNQILARGDRLTTKFLGSNVLDAFVIGLINFIFLTIFKAPYAALLSVVLGLFNFVPTFGPIAGGMVAGVVVLLTKPTLLLGFIIFTIILQQLDGNVIKPVLFGDSTGLSPFWVLVGIVVGGRIFGVLGMILGVPVLALLASIYCEIVDRRYSAIVELPAEDAPPEKKE